MFAYRQFGQVTNEQENNIGKILLDEQMSRPLSTSMTFAMPRLKCVGVLLLASANVVIPDHPPSWCDMMSSARHERLSSP